MSVPVPLCRLISYLFGVLYRFDTFSERREEIRRLSPKHVQSGNCNWRVNATRKLAAYCTVLYCSLVRYRLHYSTLP